MTKHLTSEFNMMLKTTIVLSTLSQFYGRRPTFGGSRRWLGIKCDRRPPSVRPPVSQHPIHFMRQFFIVITLKLAARVSKSLGCKVFQ